MVSKKTNTAGTASRKKTTKARKPKVTKKVPDKKPDSSTTEDMLKNLGKTPAVVFSFDTTGSMNPCIKDVRQKLRDLAEMMIQDIKGVKIGLIAHGDYCDGDNCISILDLTSDVEKIMAFITNTPNTSGGDAPECYEYVLHKAKSLSWPEGGGAFVLIGDATPHDDNPHNLNWREELQDLKAKKVNVFAMQCLKSAHQKNQNDFWEAVSGEAGTPLLVLESFNDSAVTLGAVAYASTGHKEDYETFKDVRAKKLAPTASLNLCSNMATLEAYAEANAETKVE